MSVLSELIKKDINSFLKKKNLDLEINFSVSRNKNSANGHFSTNYALIYAKKHKVNPMETANLISNEISKSNYEKVEICAPGFINFNISNTKLLDVIDDVLKKRENFSKQQKNNFYYNMEIVSANPTGWLHIGHARNGIVGDCYAKILMFLGYKVKTEYYINDAGNQIGVCATTLFWHYKNLLGIKTKQPNEIYGGDMYIETANKFIKKYKDKFISSEIDYEKNQINNDEVFEIFKKESISMFLNDIKSQLAEAKINIDHYSSEKAMYENKEIEKMMAVYKSKKKIYLKDGATWLKTSEFGDDKDRVLIKSDGSLTYIVPDLACHNERFTRENANKYINFWGGDHHGYISRLRAGLSVLGWDGNLINIEMIQMVRLIKDSVELKISKRKGTAVWMKDLIEMIGIDALRYMLTAKAASSHYDFNLDVVLQKNANNPVYYIQYCTARCNQILNKWNALKFKSTKKINYQLNKKEIELIITFDQLIDVLILVKDNCSPYLLCDYLYGLAKSFHTYYGDQKIIDENNLEISQKKIEIIKASLIVASICLNLLNVEIKEKM